LLPCTMCTNNITQINSPMRSQQCHQCSHWHAATVQCSQGGLASLVQRSLQSFQLQLQHQVVTVKMTLLQMRLLLVLRSSALAPLVRAGMHACSHCFCSICVHPRSLLYAFYCYITRVIKMHSTALQLRAYE
jgi:hypothetical protein